MKRRPAENDGQNDAGLHGNDEIEGHGHGMHAKDDER
jgi:hypothetical protein